MSELDHGRIPDTMPYTDEERALARQKQQEAEAAAKKKRRNRVLATVAAGTTLIGGGVAAVAFGMGGSKSANSVPERSPSTSAPATPGETASAATTAPSPETETQADKYGISVADNPTFEDAARAYYAKIVEYQKSSQNTYQQPGDPKYLEALFGADWENNPELSDYVNFLRDGSVTISTNHFATGENGDPEYENNIEVTGVSDVSEQPGKQVAGIATTHATDNVMETSLAAFSSTKQDVNSIGNFHLTFTNENGNWVLTEVDNLANN